MYMYIYNVTCIDLHDVYIVYVERQGLHAHVFVWACGSVHDCVMYIHVSVRVLYTVRTADVSQSDLRPRLTHVDSLMHTCAGNQPHHSRESVTYSVIPDRTCTCIR